MISGGKTWTINRTDFTPVKKYNTIVGYEKTINWTNEKTATIKIRKIGSDGAPLDATFRIQDDRGGESTVQVLATDGGYGTIDLTNLYAAGMFAYYQMNLSISEIEVNSNYIKLEQPIKISIQTSYNGGVTSFEVVECPSGVKVENIYEDTYLITITDERKTTDFNMKKIGVGNDQVSANVTLEAHKKGATTSTRSNSYSINSSTSRNINTFMQNLTDSAGYDIYISESGASKGYKNHSKFKAFTYYPDNEGLDKFQDVSNYITFKSTIGATKNSFEITLRNVPTDPREFTLIKRDKDNPDNYLAGAVFEIVPKGGTPITLITNGTKEGATVTLPDAESYTVTEISAPDGYAVDKEPRIYPNDKDKFEYIKETDDSGRYQLVVTYDNSKIKGRIKIEKYDAADPDNPDLDLAKKMAGAEFGIYIWDGTGKMVVPGTDKETYESVKNGSRYTLIDTVVIGEDGTGISGELPYNPDGYVILETKAPTDYELSYEVQVRSITKNETVTVRYEDKKKTGSLIIHKIYIDEDTNKEEPLALAHFQIYEAETDKAVSEELVTGPDGKIGPVELPYGTYYIKETEAPSGYVKVSEEQKFTLNDAHVEYEATFANPKAEYAFSLFKEDNKGNPLAGAKFGLYKAGSVSPHEDPSVEAIQTFWTVAPSGKAYVTLEEPGDYVIYELEAPEGYKLITDEKWEIHVDEDTPTAEVGPIINERLSMTLKIIKVDEDDEEIRLSGAIFEIREKDTDEIVEVTGETNENGEVAVEIPAGDIVYTVTELKAPEGYVLDAEPREVDVLKTADPATGKVTYTAEPLVVTNKKVEGGTIRLIKREKGNLEKRLEGAEYGIYSAEADLNGEPQYRLTTNSIGEAEVSDLPYGTYKVKEITPPAGYGWDEESPHTVVLSDNTPVVTIEAEDPLLKGGFRVRKVDGLYTNVCLEGAQFAVFADSEDAKNYTMEDPKGIDPIAVRETDKNGLAVFENLPYGIYYVKEIKAPEGYGLNTAAVEEVLVNEDSLTAEEAVIIFKDYVEQGALRIIKKDKDTGDVLQGAKFTVEKIGGTEEEPVVELVGNYETDKDGTIRLNELRCGVYRITETEAPAGYRISDPKSKTVTVTRESWNNPVKVTFTDEQIMTSVRIHKIDGTTIGTENPLSLAGAYFEIYKADKNGNPTGEPVAYLFTNEFGKAESIKLPLGNYVLVEMWAPEGYKLDEKQKQSAYFHFAVTDDSEEVIEKTIINYPLTGELRIEKIDEETKERLNGVEFTVYRHDYSEYAVLTTGTVDGVDGVAVLEEIPYGLYRVVETGVPEGYVDQDFEEVFWIGDGNGSGGSLEQESVVLEVSNTPGKGMIGLIKVDAEDPEVNVGGACYGIYTALKEDGDVDEASLIAGDILVTTPDETTVWSKELPWGIYYVKEISSPVGYEVNDTVYPVELWEEEPLVVVEACDTKMTGSVMIHKQDQDGNPLEYAEFALYTKDQYDKLQKDDTIPGIYLTTDEEGEAFCGNLRLDETYVLIERKAPPGYGLNEEFKKIFTPTVEKTEFEFTCTNERIGEIMIRKVDENGEPLQVAVFALYSSGPDGLKQTADDRFIAEFGNGENADAIARYPTKDLPNGWYYVKEIQAPHGGYQLSSEIREFELTDEQRSYDDPDRPYVNEGYDAEFIIRKVNENNEPMPEAGFTLYELEGSWDEEKGEKIWERINPREISLDENGYALITGLKANKNYVLVETTVPKGYKKVEDIYIYYGDDADVRRENGQIICYAERTIVNTPVKGKIRVQKEVDNDTGIEADVKLAGAKFNIWRYEPDSVPEKVAELTTDASGSAESDWLPYGTYWVEEVEAPAGTVLNEKLGTVEIDGSEEDDIYHYTHINPIVKGRIRIEKTDDQTPATRLEGAEFDIIKKEGMLTVDHLVTDANGVAQSRELPWGEYLVRETKAPAGYILGEIIKKEAKIAEEGQIITLDFVNPQGDKTGLTVRKYDKDDSEKFLEDAEFALYREGESEPCRSGATNKDGMLEFTGLEKGNYVLKETKAPEGYQLDEKDQIKWEGFLDGEQMIVIDVPNESPKGRISFVKKGDIFAGLEETPLVLYPEQKVLRWEEAELEGAEIEIYTTKQVKWNGKTYEQGDVIARVKSGEISDYLPVGDYEYQEVTAPSPYIPDAERYSVTVTAEESTDTEAEEENVSEEITLHNDHGTVELILQKIFEDQEDLSKEELAQQYEKVKFGVYTDCYLYGDDDGDDDDDNSVVEPDTLVGVFGVDENGMADGEPLKLPEGSYYVKEIATAEDYVLDAREYSFKVSYENKNAQVTVPENGEPLVNERMHGMIYLRKVGEAFSAVEEHSAYGLWQVNVPMFTEMDLAGAEVEVYTKQDIRLNGEVYKEGDLVAVLESSDNPESLTGIDLPFGTYILKEVKAPDGYILDGKEREIVLEPENAEQEYVVKECRFLNKKTKVTPQFSKRFFGVSDEEAAELYPQVVFGIYAAEEISGNVASAILQKDMLVQLITLDENGESGFDDYLPAGEYYVKELATAEGYALDEEAYYFTVEPDSSGEIRITKEPKEADGEETDEELLIMNYPEGERIPFEFKKVDEHGKSLAGAGFKLYVCMKDHEHSALAGEGSCFMEIEGLDPVFSGEDGIVYFGELPKGSYQLEEIQAPEGYTCPKGQWYIEIDPDAEDPVTIQARAKDDEAPPAFMAVERNDRNGWEYRLINYEEQHLPMAGGPGTIPYVGGGSALVAMAGLLWKKRRKEDEPEET